MKCRLCGCDVADGVAYCPRCIENRDSLRVTCPYCSNEMVAGTARIHGTMRGFIIFGLSYQNLYFKGENQPEKKVLESRAKRDAFFCPNCESIFIRS